MLSLVGCDVPYGTLVGNADEFIRRIKGKLKVQTTTMSLTGQ